MPNDLLAVPDPPTNPVWSRLYVAPGEEVVEARPVLTGDVFAGVTVRHGDSDRVRRVMVVQHPCAIRADGISLNSRLLVVEVDRCGLLPVEAWQGHFDKMPLPQLMDHENAKWQSPAAFFDRFYTASPESLAAGQRIACMSQMGVNMLLQRWVHHSSRVVVPVKRLQDVTGGPYEEADLIEEWCESRGGDPSEQANALEWLRQSAWEAGPSRQALLNDVEARASIRREMRELLAS